ncbi:Apolipoprotein N-acyltransferase [Campylobacter majalis]|uniref:Apolipoprotein N-acyltransferase n=1 Tax=Campylobacter majalis TaxID=2790656 RepID=A0ABM8Q4U3_9BACT|nr:apolipoprotein N-acyltransferase [Campylobacter majalis]CAD7287854.1 Apolipoprotein N-acyltransferase [Campylobacter majalis]
MKLENFRLACVFLIFKNLSSYFNIKIIIKAFVGALCLANFIYIYIFKSEILNLISPFITIFGLFTIIYLPRFGYFWAGFFSGILWFYWISFSFYYYDLAFLMPFVILGIALVYALMFLVASIPSFVYLRAIMLFLISYISPFGFNWFNLEATLVLGVFRTDEIGLICIFASAFLLGLKKFYKLTAIMPLVFAIQINSSNTNFIPFDLALANTDTKQIHKWDRDYKNHFINETLDLINNAINNKKRAILLPESAFPTFIDHENELMDELKNLSHKITIITGGLAYENKQSFNSTYLFENGDFKRFDKHILVPFGEEIPLPNFIKKWINKVFFDGASDYMAASDIGEYEIDGIKIRNAICYEATHKSIYKDNPKIVFAITNNGWFKIGNIISTEPILQSLLLKHYATKFHTTIYHSVNGSQSEIITPKKSYLNFKEF